VFFCREPDVPTNARITYELELLSVADQPAFHEMSPSRRLQLRCVSNTAPHVERSPGTS